MISTMERNQYYYSVGDSFHGYGITIYLHSAEYLYLVAWNQHSYQPSLLEIVNSLANELQQESGLN